MARRAAPSPDEVREVLTPIRRAAARRAKAEAEIRQHIAAAAKHEPRPTNAQIGQAAGITEGSVRAVLNGRRE